MAGTGFQSSDLLLRFNQLAGRPTPPNGTDTITDASKYQRLADAQQSVIAKIASIAPRVIYGSPTAMTSSDGGYTFQFGTDGNGYPLFPMGKAGIFASLVAIPDYPWQPGVDYLDEGTQIRMPNNRQWPGTLYWYGITPPQQMSATIQPVIQPPPARILIVIEAVRSFAEEYARNDALVGMMENKWQNEYGSWMTQLRRHFRGGGMLGPLLTPWGRPGVGFGAFGTGSYWG